MPESHHTTTMKIQKQQQRVLKSASNISQIFTIHAIFAFILLSLVSLVSCANPTEDGFQNGNDEGHDHNPTNNLEDHTEVAFQQNTELKLRKCETSKLKNGSSVELPIFLMDSSFEFDYILGNHSLENTLHACPSGEKSFFEISTSSKSAFNLLPEGENLTETNLHLIIRYMNALLDNGYLSVSNSSDKSITYYSPDEYCLNDITGHGETATATFRVCHPLKSRPVLNKCCPVGAVLGEGGCVNIGNTKWIPSYLDPKTLTLFIPDGNFSPVYHSPRLGCENREPWEEDDCNNEFYPSINGKTAFIGAYRNWEFFDHPSDAPYCYEQSQTEDGKLKNIIVLCTTGAQPETKNETSRIYMACMYVGAFFHLLTSLFYLITWPKQNIHGKVLCSCTTALFFMNVCMGTAHLLGIIGNDNPGGFCFVNGFVAQYFLIASFTWLLVVNIDLWCTFSSIRPDGGKGWKRFLIFSLGGWGFPLLVTGVSLTLNSIYKYVCFIEPLNYGIRSLKIHHLFFSCRCRRTRVPVPDYGDPICFVSPWAQGYYVYYILSIIIAIAFLFAVLTLYGLYSFKKGTNNLRSNKRAEDKQTVLLFLKLSVVMGLLWIFEVISWAATKEDAENHVVWIIFDIYNALSGILIFIIFVCKRTTLNLLEQTHPIFKVFTSAISKFTSSFTRETSSTATVSTAVGGTTGQSGKKKHYDTVVYTKEKNGQGQVNGGFE
ncbi:G-protein coupled receptor Mth [Orchesella cincta]|uniref:G-protein coupled receptor Mth n=1 Tax=Orchesella cincta TaxID=48709 RepID=A0A1D2N6D9_ORCCI|nr:G-protein coupled receptor Mth [Orchesella cincta]